MPFGSTSSYDSAAIRIDGNRGSPSEAILPNRPLAKAPRDPPDLSEKK